MTHFNVNVTMNGGLRSCEHCGNKTFFQDELGEIYCDCCKYNVNVPAMGWGWEVGADRDPRLETTCEDEGNTTTEKPK